MKHFLLAFALLFFVGCTPKLSAPQKDEGRLDLIADTYMKGKTEVAIVQLRKYISEYPKDDLAWTILGHAYSKTDKLEKAKEAYESAIDLNPEQFQSYTGLGILHRKHQNYDAAMDAYQKALKIDPTYAQAYSSMVTIALKQENDKQALEYAKKGFELDQTDAVIASNLSIAYHYNNDFENRDKYKEIAKELGYDGIQALDDIFSGELTIRD